jgi:hypothetical protein
LVITSQSFPLFVFPWKMRNRIFSHCTGYKYNTSFQSVDLKLNQWLHSFNPSWKGINKNIIHTNTFLLTGHYTYQYVFVYWTLYIPIRFCLLDIKTPYNFLFLLAIMLSVLLRYTDSVTPDSSYLQKHYIDCSKMELGLNNPITRVNHW